METKFKETEAGFISIDWEIKKLNLIVDKLGDGLHGTPKYDDNGNYYFINGNNLVEGKIRINGNTKKCPKEEYEKYKKELNNRTILISINGTLGNIALYNNEKIFLGKSACYFNLKDNFDIQYIKYVFHTNYFKIYLENNATGTTIKNMSLKSMRDFNVPLPPLEEQKAIAKILSDLDEKIEINRKINENLEELGQTLFKRWFIDFEFPNEQGKPYKSSGGEMVESELGEIPKGWKVDKLGKFIDLQKGLSYKGKSLSEDKNDDLLVNLGNFKPYKGYRVEGSKYYNGEFKDRHTIKEGDMIIANTDITQDRVVIGSPIIIPNYFKNNNLIYTHHIFKVLYLRDFSKFYLYNLLGLKSFKEQIVNYATGTTVLALPKDALLNYRLPIPDISILNNFDKIGKNIYLKICELEKEIQSLQEIRDSLLPKLMSGQIRVK